MCKDIERDLEKVAEIIGFICDNKMDAYWHIGYVSGCKDAAEKYAYHYRSGDAGVYTNLIF